MVTAERKKGRHHCILLSHPSLHPLSHLLPPSFLPPRLVQDATLSSEAHGYALEGLKSQLAEAELQLKHEREATQAVKVSSALGLY